MPYIFCTHPQIWIHRQLHIYKEYVQLLKLIELNTKKMLLYLNYISIKKEVCVYKFAANLRRVQASLEWIYVSITAPKNILIVIINM